MCFLCLPSFLDSKPGSVLGLAVRGLMLLAACAVSLIGHGRAAATLSLYPMRVELEGRQRAAQVDLLNTGTRAQTYRIALVRRRMTEQGQIVAVDAPQDGEHFADDLIRFSPRQVTILPGRSQTIRLLLRKPAELPDGEYRSHLQFEPVDLDPEPASDPGPSAPKGALLQVQMGASIPVIVRHGATRADLVLSSLSLEPASGAAQPVVSLALERSGNRSVFGDLSITVLPRQGREVEVARAAGVAVYAPNPVRRMRLSLSLPSGLDLAGARLRATFRERPEAGRRLLAEGQLALP